MKKMNYKMKYMVDVIFHIKHQIEVEADGKTSGLNPDEIRAIRAEAARKAGTLDLWQSSMGEEPGVSIEVGEVRIKDEEYELHRSRCCLCHGSGKSGEYVCPRCDGNPLGREPRGYDYERPAK